jgi:hypothetical protein
VDSNQISLSISLENLRADLLAVQIALRDLPAEACPEGYVMLDVLALPSCLRAGHLSLEFFQDLGLSVLGSRHVKLPPRHKDSATTLTNTTCDHVSIKVAGLKSSLDTALEKLEKYGEQIPGQLLFLESIIIADPLASLPSALLVGQNSYEIVLQLMPGVDPLFPYSQFVSFASKLGFHVFEEHRSLSCSIIFAPVRGPGQMLPKLAKFTFLRQVGEIPKLRCFRPLEPPKNAPKTSLGVRSSQATTEAKSQTLLGQTASFDSEPNPKGDPAPSSPQADHPITLPSTATPPPDLNVVILDGGLPANHPIGPWVKDYLLSDSKKKDFPGGPEHGLAVASAFLFGPLPASGTLPSPDSLVTIFRLLDASSEGDDDFIIFKLLNAIKVVLETGKWTFVNLSLGPNLPISDGKIHAWTSTLDELANQFDLFLTVAAGNNGNWDAHSDPAARIQVPADAINVVSVGATNSQKPDWRRASYSALGPGRIPAIVKPDLLIFGGDNSQPFMVLDPDLKSLETNEEGTSFAAPYLLRRAVALRAAIGSGLSVLAIKALLVHQADRAGHDVQEVGWGRVPEVKSVLTGAPGERRLVFQGQLPPGHRLIARLPEIDPSLTGKVTVRATFCFNSKVSIHDPFSYSLTALEAVFLPNLAQSPGQDEPLGTIAPFFDLDGGEIDLAAEPQKVIKANVRSNEMSFERAKLIDPGFMIRQVNQAERRADPVKYCLVVSLLMATN